jgi:hypothetical protein
MIFKKILNLRRSFTLIFLFFFLAILYFLANPLYAQTTTPINLSLSPTFVSLATDPGQETTSQFKVTNNSNVQEDLKIELAKFELTQGGAGLTLKDLTSEDEFARWITITPETFSLAPNQSETIRFTISPPKDAALGYYYALVVKRQKEPTTKETKQTVITGAPALPVLLEVHSPNAKRELQLVQFTTDKAFYEYLPVKFSFKVKNTGNVHLVPSGDIFVDWGRTKDVALLSANQARGNILPQAERTFDVSWGDGMIVRGVDGKTKWDLTKADRFRIGRYTAHLLLVYDNGQRDIPLEATISFWVFPWKIILGILVVLYFAFIGLKGTIYTYARKFRNRR